MIDETYKNHLLFKQLSEYIKFYKNLSFHVFGFLKNGVNNIFNIDSYLYSSIQGTLESINNILLNGRINDSYALLRKYYDSVIINIYTTLYLEDNFNIDNFVVEKINNWVGGKEKLPEFRIMSQYIRSSKKLLKITELLNKDDTYKIIRDRCNDHTHYNYFYYILLNDSELHLKNRIKSLDIFSNDLRNIFIFHFSNLFYINEHYMMASDYTDNLDLGIPPEEGSQYYVAPFVQKVFNEVIKINRKDLAKEIKNRTCMKLE